jgi:hypothetical protein
MSTPAKRQPTNGDLFIRPAVERAKKAAAEAFSYAREHPDEAAVALAPVLMLMAATRRHKLSYPEALLISEIGFWAGVLAAQRFREWKDRPAAAPRLRKVT